MEFKLSDTFIDEYKVKDVNWGPLGEFIYLRTYSRIKEDGSNEKWWETVRRVVEGTYSIQKEHCNHLRLAWNNSKAQKSAQIMFNKIFSFKFLPPGRGLWMMGTNFVKEKGSAALVNCSFISSEDIDTRGSFIFTWIMDALMLGVGAGLDTKGAGKITIKNPKTDGVFVIQDSRESWVESLGILLDSFFHGKTLPTFDYSLIRPYGSPIRGFGGTASGPGPLRKMHEDLIFLLSKRVGQRITSVDIVDIENIISVCVISGNVRRCLPENYLVEMNDGTFKRIDSISSGEKIKFNGNNYLVKNVFDNGEQETVRILTKNGFVESTKEHKWLVCNKKNDISWKTALNISKNPTEYSLLSPK